MANTNCVYLSGINLDRPVLATLTDTTIDETTRIALDENLTAALKDQLASAFHWGSESTEWTPI